ncbi:hypothetical protein ACKLNQ_18015 [Myroides odoratimimus]|uniref:hypothetical protein n=1 Tax=Myroides odoratimimus TaxID=76832 RepID=UPI0038D36286
MNYIKYINKYLFCLVFTIIVTSISYGQSVNAGGSAVTCGTTHTLSGSTENGDTKGLTWSVVGKPTGATDPVISNPSILKPSVTGMNKPGIYTFRLTKVNPSGSVYSEVQITSSGDISSFSAGSNILTIPASIGTVNLNGVIPEGFTGEWRAVNVLQYEVYSTTTDINTNISNKHIANPTFSLIKKSDHDTDPAYKLILKITSIYNPYCVSEKEIIVRFIPNPRIIVPEKISKCGESVIDDTMYFDLLANSPAFTTHKPYTAGSPTSGTTITLNTIEKPGTGVFEFKSLEERRMYFRIDDVGLYKFTLTIKNATGEYTTPIIIFNKTGVKPGEINFVLTNHPEQYMNYTGGGTGGELLCGKIGDNSPVNVYFELNEKDDPLTTITTTSVYSKATPGEIVPNVQMFGTGKKVRFFTVTPPTGGWKAGTYPIYVETSNGGCSISTTYYIHVSDGNRPDLKVEDVMVCYPGTGTVNANVILPTPFQETINKTYFQDFSGNYVLEVVSKPTGSAEPQFESDIWNQRTLKSTSTVISNLNKAGEYVFKIKAIGYGSHVDWLVKQEYECSGTSRETTFKVIVSEQIGANAGSDQTGVFCRDRTVLVGNDPGDIAIGKWTVESAPVGTTPFFSDNSSSRTLVGGLDKTGSYKFKWTIKTGDCIASDIVEVIADQDNCTVPKIITNPMLPNKTQRR